MPEGGFARAADGCRLRYERAGSGPAVLLAAGLGGLGAFWAPVRARLAPHFEVLTYDHRGCGASDRPEQGYTVEGMAADAAAILDHAGIGRAHVVGHSTGGAIAQVLALDFPARVGRIVASGSWAAPDARFRALFAHRLDTLLRAGPEVYARQSQLLGYDAAWFDAHAAELDRALAGATEALAPLAVAASRLRMLPGFDRAADLGRIAADALVLAASDDALIPAAMSRRLAALIPRALYREMTGGHFFPATAPDPYATAILAFLASRRGSLAPPDGALAECARAGL